MTRRNPSRPSRPTSSRIRMAPTSLAPSWAERSPCRSAGVRVAARNGSRKSSIHSPSATAGIGGTRIPSWSTVVAWAGIEPGASPPTSAWCARFPTHATSSPSTNTGRTMVRSFRWVPPA